VNKASLTRPFEPHQIRQRPGQHGRTLSYVDVTAVIARLNEACDEWSFEITEHQVMDGEVIVLGKLTADGVVKTAFGGSTITIDKAGAVVSVADDLKAAASDALKKSASLLGVGLELYGGQVPANPPQPERRAPATGNRLTSRQLAAIHAASRKAGMSRASLAAMVQDQTGKTDLAHLSRTEASNLISELSGSNGGG
jgi:hypothetical protein